MALLGGLCQSVMKNSNKVNLAKDPKKLQAVKESGKEASAVDDHLQNH